MEMAQSVARWFRLKQYQIEVTFGVYIFTPIEKFVFCTCSHMPLLIYFLPGRAKSQPNVIKSINQLTKITQGLSSSSSSA